MKKFYYPGKKFPSVSITGEHCELSCPHCEGRFLKGMKSVSDPEELYEFAVEHERSGGNGFLLSGGSTEKGEVPLRAYLSVVSKIKEKTSLEVNVHTGLPSEDLVYDLANTGIDTVSYDMIGSQKTIDEVYGMDASPEDYKKGYEMLKEAGLRVIPHITVGLNAGELDGEFKAIEMLAGPSTLVLNSLIPSKAFGKRVRKEDFFSVMEHVGSGTDII
ncbi:MAG: radical SAM protein, partial [Candidatus Natronoplasma sp.]